MTKQCALCINAFALSRDGSFVSDITQNNNIPSLVGLSLKLKQYTFHNQISKILVDCFEANPFHSF